MSDTIYTPEIQEYVERILHTFDESGTELGTDFFNEEFSNPTMGREITAELIAQRATLNLVEREDGNITLTVDQMLECLEQAIVRGALFELRANGLVDWVEDENGEDVIFLTERGKTVGNSLFNHGHE